MSSWVAPLAVFADVAILLTLIAAVANPRLSPVAQALTATCAFACAWLLNASFDALRAPGWTVLLGDALIAASIVVLVVTVHHWTLRGADAEAGTGSAGGGDGGGPRGPMPDAPRSGAGASDPTWWPEFERQFAAYLAAAETEKPVRATEAGAHECAARGSPHW